MIPVLSSAQMKEVDSYTIKNEPVASIDLMERASVAFVSKFNELEDSGKSIKVFSGTGNNGGDGLAIARMLCQAGRKVEVFTIGNLEKASDDFQMNKKRLEGKCGINHIDSEDKIPQLGLHEVVIDGLFGSGLTRPVEGLYGTLIQKINKSESTVFSIDMPSGLFADSYTDDGAIIEASHTISFQTPKLAFFQPTLGKYTGDWHVVDIGLDKAYIDKQEVDFYYTEKADIIVPKRYRFAHKGNAGRMLLVSGSRGKMGATSLCARAAMRTGCGLLYVHVPRCGTNILQMNVQEAIVLEDEHEEIITEVNPAGKIDAVGIGPGIGTNALTKSALENLIKKVDQSMVLDADAINILSENVSLIDLLPDGSILTPHPGEFKRLVGKWDNDFHKLEMLKSFCKKHQVNVVLKGAFSAVCNTKGEIFFNCSGNPGMATAGSGDVLTGMIAALLGQGFSQFDALRTGVYLQGLAGDLAAEKLGEISMIASDIIEHIPMAIRKNVKIVA